MNTFKLVYNKLNINNIIFRLHLILINMSFQPFHGSDEPRHFSLNIGPHGANVGWSEPPAYTGMKNFVDNYLLSKSKNHLVKIYLKSFRTNATLSTTNATLSTTNAVSVRCSNDTVC